MPPTRCCRTSTPWDGKGAEKCFAGVRGGPKDLWRPGARQKKAQASGAKAQTHGQAFTARLEVVPLPKRFMKPMNMKGTSIMVCVCLGLLSLSARGEPACRAEIKAAVEISSNAVFLSDLLTRDSCPALAGRAARVRLGKAPLAGSARVFAGEELRARLERLESGDPRKQKLSVQVPERVVVRAAEGRASCGEIWASLASGGAAGIPTTLPQKPGEVTCGAAERVRSHAGLEAVRKSWDPLLASWNLVARCRRPEECVPFLVRVLGSAPSQEFVLPTSPLKPKPGLSGPPAALRLSRDLAVRPGQRATLVWEENGLRLEIPVVCLDGGVQGETVRARVGQRGRTLRAIVTESGQLRAIS